MIESPDASRQSGKIVEWNDGKGFGWVESKGSRVFAHIKSFEKGQRRPGNGDAVTFVPGADEQGRRRAILIRLDKQRSTIGMRNWFLLLLLLALPMIAFTKLPFPWWALPSFIAVMSLITWSAYLVDKKRALSEEWRIPEIHLHFLELMGGWPGAFLGQRQFRHKISKSSFLFVFWAIVLLWQVIAFEILTDGKLTSLLSEFLKG